MAKFLKVARYDHSKFAKIEVSRKLHVRRYVILSLLKYNQSDTSLPIITMDGSAALDFFLTVYKNDNCNTLPA